MNLPFWFEAVAITSLLFIFVVTCILLGLRDSPNTSKEKNK